MSALGGYFGLEMNKGESEFHTTPFKFSSGRASLMFIIQALRPKKIYVSYYTCNALLEPLILFNVPYSFYAIDDNLEIIDPPELKSNELLIYINYFDIKRNYVARLSEKYGNKFIADCTQAYFLKGNGHSWYFNSSRKSFGVPDGSDLYVPKGYHLLHRYNELTFNTNFFTGHLINRYNGRIGKGYEVFKQNESIVGSGLNKMSLFTSDLLSKINYETVMKIRKDNFKYIHELLSGKNQIAIDENQEHLPAFYPYLPELYFEKELFWKNDVFVPSFWNDCLTRSGSELFERETHISKFIIPIPTDQRYTISNFDPIFKILKR